MHLYNIPSSRFVFISLLICTTFVFAAAPGELRGRVRDRQTQEDLPGATIRLDDTKIGGKTDIEGRFVITEIPAGTYRVTVSAAGYNLLTRTDIVISPNRSQFFAVELDPKPVEADELVVKADPFKQNPEISTSTLRMTQEEIRRAPGAREDIARAVQVIPGVQMTSDDRNDLVVRGGSPVENLFRIDGIEFPNPNHFGTQGATGGPIGMINNEFVQEINLLSGGFPARYGDKLSSVVDVTYREGTPKFTGNALLGFAGAGLTLEGPLSKGSQANYLFSFRKSYLDLIIGLLNYGALPRYWDAQGKITYPINATNRLSLLSVVGSNKIIFEPDLKDTENTATEYLENGTNSGVVGLTWTHLFPKYGYSKVIVSHDRARYYTLVDTLESFTNEVWHRNYKNTSTELQTDFRNEWNLRLNDHLEVSLGAQYKQIGFQYNVYQDEPINFDNIAPFPDTVLAHRVVESDMSFKTSAFATLTWRPNYFWTINTGARYDYFDYTGGSNVSPRLGVTYHLSPAQKLNASYGWFTQAPPLITLKGNQANRDLSNLIAEHVVVGYENLIATDVRFTLEAYHKLYRDIPVFRDKSPWVSLQNAGAVYGDIGTFEAFVNQGSGKSYGLEAMIQKKLETGLYGIASATYSRTEYQAKDGIRRWGNFDTPLIVNLIGGYKPNPNTEFSAKWTYAAGAPYTPLMQSASAQLNYMVFDTLHVNSVRRAPYHRLDLRYDYRKFFTGWNLVSWFSVENVYNRENFLATYWNRKTQKPQTFYQTGFFPIGGFTVEW